MTTIGLAFLGAQLRLCTFLIFGGPIVKRAFIFAFLPFVCLSLELYSVVWCALILPIIAIIKHAMAFVFQFVSIVGIPRSFVELFDMLFTAALMSFRFFFGFVF